MLKFSIRSWHFRLAYYVMSEVNFRNITLCKYFWTVVASILLAPFMFIAYHVPDITVPKNIRKLLPLTPILMILIFDIIYQRWDLVALLLATMTVCAIFFFVARWYTEYRWEHRSEKEPKPKKEKKPNLMLEYVKAKKSKICPMIQWEMD